MWPLSIFISIQQIVVLRWMTVRRGAVHCQLCRLMGRKLCLTFGRGDGIAADAAVVVAVAGVCPAVDAVCGVPTVPRAERAAVWPTASCVDDSPLILTTRGNMTGGVPGMRTCIPLVLRRLGWTPGCGVVRDVCGKTVVMRQWLLAVAMTTADRQRPGADSGGGGLGNVEGGGKTVVVRQWLLAVAVTAADGQDRRPGADCGGGGLESVEGGEAVLAPWVCVLWVTATFPAQHIARGQIKQAVSELFVFAEYAVVSKDLRYVQVMF